MEHRTLGNYRPTPSSLTLCDRAAETDGHSAVAVTLMMTTREDGQWGGRHGTHAVIEPDDGRMSRRCQNRECRV